MNEHELKKIFTDQKADVPDDGFTERVVGRLPERPSRFPLAVMTTCVVVALALIAALTGVGPVVEQIEAVAASLGRMEMPPAGAVAAYFAVLAVFGAIGYSLAGVEE